jgi:2,4-dienoyl-CoA reductase-like NADH-dependent reductase (Old Yellow Enzyme family)
MEKSLFPMGRYSLIVAPLGSPLFESINIGPIKVKNRFVRSATHEWLAEEDGTLTDPIFQIYKRLAKGEIGLIVSGYSFVSPCGKGSPGQQGIFDDRAIDGYSQLARVVHENGSRLFLQVVHCGRSALTSESCPVPMAPSAMPIPGTKTKSRKMSEDDIERTILDFVRAVARSKKAGADGAQVHCAHGFLLSEFISPFLNRREDDWGGDTERRTRIVVEILRRAKKESPDYPIAAKMNVLDGVEGGIDLAESRRIAKILGEEGIDAIETSGGIDEAPKEITCQKVAGSKDEAYFREYSRAIKKVVNCPVILVGGLRSLRIMESMISEGYSDMVSLSRPLIREPNLVKKFMSGASTVAKCESCNKCFDSDGVKCNHAQYARESGEAPP